MSFRPAPGKCRAAAAADVEIRRRDWLNDQLGMPSLERVMPQQIQPQLVPQMSYASAGGFMRDMQLFSMFVGNEFQHQRDLREQQRFSDFQSALLSGKF